MNLLGSLMKASSLQLILSSTIWFTILDCSNYDYVNYKECKRYYDQGDTKCETKGNWCKYYFDCPPTIDKEWWGKRKEMCVRFEIRYGEERMESINPNNMFYRRCSMNRAECSHRFNCPDYDYDLSRLDTKPFVVRDTNANNFLWGSPINVQAVVCLVRANDEIEKAKCGMLTSSRTMVRLHDEGEKIITPDQFKSYRVLIRTDIRSGNFAKESKLIRSEYISDACSGIACLMAKYTFMDELPHNVTIYTKGYYGNEGFVGRYFGHWTCRGRKDIFGPSETKYIFKQRSNIFQAEYPYESECIPKQNMFIVREDEDTLVGVAVFLGTDYAYLHSIHRKSYNELNKEMARPQLEGR